MKRWLFDTGIAADYINRRSGIRERARDEVARGKIIGIGIPVLGELFFGIERSGSRDTNLQRLRLALPSLTVWPLTEEAAAEFGRLAAILRRIGRPMQQIDIMIGAIALNLGSCTVVSKDRDLVDVPGRTVENWAV